MTYDFRANQVRLNRIISSGSIPIIIYASSSATDLQGGKNFPDPGSDVFLFVSGSSTAKTLFGGDVVVSGSLTASIVSASQLTGSLQNITTGVPYLVGGTNITLATSSIGQITITSTAASSGGADVSASYVVMSATSSLANERVLTAGNGIRLTDGGAGNPVTVSEAIWTEQTNIFATTTSSIGIKTTEEHTGVDLFISGSDTTGFGANLVLYSDLSNFGLPRLVLSSSSGSLGSLIGYDNDISGLVDGINIDIPSTRNFGFRIGGNTTATTVDSAGNLNVRYGSQSTAYFDVTSRMVGIGVTPSLLASYTNASRLVLRDTNNLGIYQLFISNEDSGPNPKSGIAFAFGATSISGAIYAKSDTNTDTYDRKGLNALIPTGNSFSWRTTGAHLGELTDSGNLIISGSVKAYTGFTGSLSGTIGGLPFIVGGPNITANYNALGQWALTGSSGGGGGDTYWTSTANNAIYTTGSAAATVFIASTGVIVTGSYIQANPGGSSLASSAAGFAQGYNVQAQGSYSHAEGEVTVAGGTACHAEGEGTTAGGHGAHAEGWYSATNGQYSHAEGQGTNAGTFYNDGLASHAEGYGSTTVGNHSHAEGQATTTRGAASHAEGYGTVTYGDHSHAEGYGSITYGSATHAGGLYTIASGSDSPTATPAFSQTAYGKYNKRDNTTSLFVVGDGTGNSDALRHDILRVESGSVQVTGSLIATGITGSISGTVGGLPFLVAGSNVTASYNGSGQWTISANASGGGGSTNPGGLDQQIQFNSGSTFSGSSNLTYNYTTNTLTLTGPLTASTVVAGGVNITPVTASLFVYGDGTNRGSGSISGLFESGSLMTAGTIGKFDVEILAMSYGSQTGASWKYTATALWPSSGNFSFLAATELAAEYGPTAGLYNPAAEWDVNFNSLGQIELTGSAPALALPGGTSFYVQVTKKMVATYGAILA